MLSTASRVLASTFCVLFTADPAKSDLLVSVPEGAPPPPALGATRIEALLPEPLALLDRGRLFRDDELAAHFTRGKLARASAAFAGERFGEALILLETEGQTPPVRLLRALCQLELGQTAAAAENLTALAETYPPMRDECLVRAAAANEKLGRTLSAADGYGLVSPSSRRFAEARLNLSRVLLEYGDPDAALAALDPLIAQPRLDRERRAAAFLARAGVAAARRDLAAQREALFEVFTDGAEAQVRVAAARLATLGGVPAAAAARRAIALIERRQLAQALSLVQPLVKKESPDLLCAERLAQGLILQDREDLPGATLALREAVGRCAGEPERPRALLSLASVLALDSPKEARRTLDRLVAEHPTSALAARALLDAAEIDLGLGERAKARARLGQVGNQFGDGDLAADALFRSFWLGWKEDPRSADLAPLVATAELPVRAASALQRERARYWVARALQERGEVDRAASAYASLAREGRTSFYGQLALGKLAALHPLAAEQLSMQPIIPAVSGRWPVYSGPEGDEPRLLTAIELARLGLRETPAAVQAISRPGQSKERTRLLFHLLRVFGDDTRAEGFARRAAREHLGEWAPEDGPIFAAAFARPFADLVEKHAVAVGIAPSLLQALIREESAFNPKARSWAGAMGLAQLMVPTAREVAQQVGAPWPGAQGLYDPDFNLRLGSRYLANVLKRFEGKEGYAVASYNAGPNRVARWVKSRPALPLDEWVEDIPIAETRWYVKRVLSSERVYRELARSGHLASAR